MAVFTACPACNKKWARAIICLHCGKPFCRRAECGQRPAQLYGKKTKLRTCPHCQTSNAVLKGGRS